MAAPEVATESGDGGPELGDDEEPDDVAGESLDAAEELAEQASGESDAPEPEGEPNVEEVELSDDDLTGDASDLFTGTEDATSGSSDDGGDGDDEEESDDETDALDALGQRGESMEEAINDGAARLAVVGLDDEDDKDGLQDEFTEVFEAFRLGYFGSRFMEEYVFTDDDEEVDPTWGLLGAMITCGAFIVWMRPDGDEMVGMAKDAVEGIIGGDLP